jgi:hypothetical protein
MMNKARTLVFLTLVLAVSSFAQDAMPTKEETVNYINKKLQDVVGKEEKLGKVATKFTAFSFALKSGKIEFDTYKEITYEGRTRNERESQVFNPAYMIAGDAAVYDCGAVVGESICLKFSDKLVKITTTSGSTTYASEAYDAVIIPLDLKIPELKSRLMKALRHLRDLAKAEDDPFGN